MSASKKVIIERPNSEVTIDFLSFCPCPTIRVEGATVKVALEYNKATGEASLHVYAVDATDGEILLDEVRQLYVKELDEE